MRVIIAPGTDECARAVADIVQGAVRGAGPLTVGLATGSSPLPAYRELIRRHREEGLSFAAVTAVLLDEYVGLREGHPQAYRQVIRDVFTGHVDIADERVFGPDGGHPDPAAAAQAYDRLLSKVGPVEVQILGIGANGHIGFNEPSSSLGSRTRAATLSARTRSDNAGYFADPAEVPRHVITQGLATISGARQLVLVATGSEKAAGVAAAVEGPLTAAVPASVLQLHPQVTVVLDEEAAGELVNREYYDDVARHPLPATGH